MDAYYLAVFSQGLFIRREDFKVFHLSSIRDATKKDHLSASQIGSIADLGIVALF